MTAIERLRRLLRRDWLCQGCWRQGTRKWFSTHPCPERDAMEERARELGRRYPGSWLFAALASTGSEE